MAVPSLTPGALDDQINRQPVFGKSPAGSSTPKVEEPAAPAARPAIVATPTLRASAPQTPASPFTPVAQKSQQIAAQQQEAAQYVSQLVHWADPKRSALVLGGSLALLGLVAWAFNGNHSWTVVQGLATLLLLDLALNILRSTLSTEWQTSSLWVGSSWTAAVANGAGQICDALAVAHDRMMACADPHITLKVALGLWVAALLGRYTGLFTFLLLALVASFTIPLLWSRHGHVVDAATADHRKLVQTKLDSLHLPRAAYFVAGGLVLVLLFFLPISKVQIAIAAIVLIAFYRTLLAPSEVEALRTAAAPYTQSARKTGQRVSVAVDDLVAYTTARKPSKPHFA